MGWRRVVAPADGDDDEIARRIGGGESLRDRGARRIVGRAEALNEIDCRYRGLRQTKQGENRDEGSRSPESLVGLHSSPVTVEGSVRPPPAWAAVYWSLMLDRCGLATAEKPGSKQRRTTDGQSILHHAFIAHQSCGILSGNRDTNRRDQRSHRLSRDHCADFFTGRQTTGRYGPTYSVSESHQLWDLP